MNKINPDDNFKWAAKWAIQHDFFVAPTLQAYCSLKQINDQELASILNISEKSIPVLALCGKPDVKDPFAFRKDVECIANYVGASAVELSKIFREVEAYKAHQKLE